MGRLIDAEKLREEVNSWGMNDYEPSDFIDAIDDVPTVEAIPKDQYESRLKADMLAMLAEIQLQFENGKCEDMCDCWRLIQNKINKAKGEKRWE